MLSVLFFLLQSAYVITKGPVAFFPPAAGGGSNLDIVTTVNLSEPLNVIISGQSSAEVLRLPGLDNYMLSLGFGDECLGLHENDDHIANLGDGRGYLKPFKIYRQNYGDPVLGTCRQTAIGGNHGRLFQQRGRKARSYAWFLAFSHEEDLDHQHTISKNGYNAGRDALVQNATQHRFTKWGNVTYQSKVDYISGLLQPGSKKINHGISQDGRVALFTVTVVKQRQADQN